jgi:hypothetical protein
MIKVRVRLSGTGVAAASGLVALAGAPLGCAMEPVEPGDEPTAEAEDALSPGSGTLSLDGFPGSYSLTLTTSTTDEFLRAGETLKIEMPVWLLWDKLNPGLQLPTDLARLAAISAKVTVRARDKTTTIATLTAPTASHVGQDPYSFEAVTKAFIVPTKADWIGFEVLVTDAVTGSTAQIPLAEMPTLAIFGGELPSKSLFMDQVQSTKRQRIIEGDDPIAGAELVLAYTDWRADVVVDKSQIDTQIGKAMAGTRFGWVEIPIYGKIVHEVSYGVYFDDGGGWRSEVALTPNTNSRYLGPSRTAYEGKVAVPAKARRMALYAHVKTYLLADYTPYSNISQQWYAPGSLTEKADRYDNPNGSFTNYTFSVANTLP